MLLLEWDKWWESIPSLTAEENLAAYTVGVLADAGWKLDREDYLNTWRETIARGRAVAQSAQDSRESIADAFNRQPGALRQMARAVSSWLHESLIGPGPKRGMVDWVGNEASEQAPATSHTSEITASSHLEDR